MFKEFDFLEAEHDSISESTESCFNWLSTMRSPRCGACHADVEEHDDLGDEHEDEEFIQPDEYDDVEIEQNISSSPQGGSLTSGTTPPSAAKKREIFDSHGVLLRSTLTLRHNESIGDKILSQNHKRLSKARASISTASIRIMEQQRKLPFSKSREASAKIRRPLSSRASDSNDISSDRTPIQSAKHSEEEDDVEEVGEEDIENLMEEDEEFEEDEEDSCPSCPASDDDELVTGKQRQRNYQRRYRSTINRHSQQLDDKKEFKMLKKTPKNVLRQNVQHLRSISLKKPLPMPLQGTSVIAQQSPSPLSSQSPNSMSFIASTSGGVVGREHLTAFTGVISNFGDDTGQDSALMSLETTSIATSAAQQLRNEDLSFQETEHTKWSIYLECNHHASGRVEKLWNAMVLEVGNGQNAQMTSDSIMLFTQLLRVIKI